MRWLCCGIVCLVGVAGCGDSMEGASVEGTVTFKGEVMPGGTVTFVPENGARSSAVIDQGHYLIRNAPPGPVKIVVTGPGPRSDNPKAKPTLVVPSRYADVKKSDLEYVVTTGPQTHDVELNP